MVIDSKTRIGPQMGRWTLQLGGVIQRYATRMQLVRPQSANVSGYENCNLFLFTAPR
jgi:hypothetical protein